MTNQMSKIYVIYTNFKLVVVDFHICYSSSSCTRSSVVAKTPYDMLVSKNLGSGAEIYEIYYLKRLATDD